MTCMIDHWHDLYHADEPDYANCPYCADELFDEAVKLGWAGYWDSEIPQVIQSVREAHDRLEDREV